MRAHDWISNRVPACGSSPLCLLAYCRHMQHGRVLWVHREGTLLLYERMYPHMNRRRLTGSLWMLLFREMNIDALRKLTHADQSFADDISLC